MNFGLSVERIRAVKRAAEVAIENAVTEAIHDMQKELASDEIDVTVHFDRIREIGRAPLIVPRVVITLEPL